MRNLQPIGNRFWSKVNKEGPIPPHIPEIGPCWVYEGARSNGYGQFKITFHNGKNRQERAHRVAWVLTFGPIRDDDLILHHCDNPPCVRPTHLFTGTNTDNRRDAASKGRIPQPAHLRRPGASNGRARFTEVEVREMRRLYHEEHLLQREIGLRFGATQATVSRIVLYRTWKHT